MVSDQFDRGAWIAQSPADCDAALDRPDFWGLVELVQKARYGCASERPGSPVGHGVDHDHRWHGFCVLDPSCSSVRAPGGGIHDEHSEVGDPLQRLPGIPVVHERRHEPEGSVRSFPLQSGAHGTTHFIRGGPGEFVCERVGGLGLPAVMSDEAPQVVDIGHVHHMRGELRGGEVDENGCDGARAGAAVGPFDQNGGDSGACHNWKLANAVLVLQTFSSVLGGMFGMPTRPHQTDPEAAARWADSRRRVGARVRELRLAAGMTQEQLALDAGLSRSQLGDLELGYRGLLFERLDDLAAVLGVDPAELMRPAQGGRRTS